MLDITAYQAGDPDPVDQDDDPIESKPYGLTITPEGDALVADAAGNDIIKVTPAAGELLLYPGGLSEVEILFPYGATRFASKMGQLAGNHFATIVEGNDQLSELGRIILWEGAQPIVFEEAH